MSLAYILTKAGFSFSRVIHTKYTGNSA